MKTQINKWGNSAAVRIPASTLADTGLSIHSNINIEAKEGRIIIEAAENSRKKLKLPFSEAALLEGLDEKTSHADEIATPSVSELGDV